MATCIHSSQSCLPPFYTIPIFPLIWGIFIHFKERLPEAICCCLQTCNVDAVLLVMYIYTYQLSLSLLLIKASYVYIYAIY